MIGILLALQVNNWNDRQKVISKERELLDNVLDNMKTDSISLSNVISYSEEILRIHQDLIELANEQISENEHAPVSIHSTASVDNRSMLL